MRPRRKRKLTNYGEGHLHWIEESQIHKALMKSLREKKYPFRGSSEAGESLAEQNPSCSHKMPRLSAAVSHSSDKEEDNNYLDCSVNIENIRDKLSSDLRCLINSTGADQGRKSGNATRFQNLRLSKRLTQKLRNQFGEDQSSCLLPHAAMMQSRNSDKSVSFSVKECSVALSKKNMDKNKQSGLSQDAVPPHDEDDTSLQAPKARAQRKFASNVASPSKAKGNVTMRKKETQNLEPSLPLSDEKLPETADFLTFLCFRNTPLREKLNLSEITFCDLKKRNDV